MIQIEYIFTPEILSCSTWTKWGRMEVSTIQGRKCECGFRNRNRFWKQEQEEAEQEQELEQSADGQKSLFCESSHFWIGWETHFWDFCKFLSLYSTTCGMTNLNPVVETSNQDLSIGGYCLYYFMFFCTQESSVLFFTGIKN